MKPKESLVRVALLRQIAVFVIGLGQSIIISRLLTPKQIGVYSVAMATLVLATSLKSAGISVFIMKERELSRDSVRSALGFSMALCWTFAVAIGLSSHWMAEFYGDDQIATIARIAAVSFLIAPFQALASGLMSRHLMLNQLAIAGLAGTAAGAMTGVGLVLIGLGPVALAWADLVNILVSTVLLFVARIPDFSFVPKWTRWQGIWGISSWSLASSLLNQLGGRSSELVLGKTLGLRDAAIFDRAEGLPRMIWTHFTPVILGILTPLLAHEIRGGDNVRDLTERRMRYIACLFIPAFMAVGTQAKFIVLVLFGDQWVASVPLVQWMCLGSAIVSPFTVIGSALSAAGRTKLLFPLNAIEQASRIIVLVLTGAVNLEILAICLNVVPVTYAVAATAIGCSVGYVKLGNLFATLWPGIVTGIAVFGVGQATNAAFAALPPHHVVQALTSVSLLGVTWLLCIWAFEQRVLKFMLSVFRPAWVGPRLSSERP